ncbi:MAG: CoA transferase [Acidimicrobiia bacterium]|nr:CoA transferase [Acidimicrobiia bacterium]
MGVLDGIRVLDFGRFIAGPFCATLLGDLGAEVIRVEKRSGGEDRFLSPVAEDGTGATHLNLGRNKRGMTLDPRTPGGGAIRDRLVESADVVVVNLPRKGLEAMGLDYPSLTAIRPDIILTSVDAYGDEGPYADRVGFDGVGQAMAANTWLTGPLGHPTRSYTPYVDFGTASLAAYATMAALWHRERTGEGQHVQGALLRTAMHFNSSIMTEEAVVGKGRVSTWNRGQTSGPTDIFEAEDGWVVLQVVGWPVFARLAGLLGRADWLEDARFATDDGRGAFGAELSEAIGGWVAERTVAEAIADFNDAGVPSAPVLDPRGALDDPHVVATQMFTPMPYPGTPSSPPIVVPPVHLSATPAEVRHRAPTLGEHTDEVLAELGFSAGDIAGFRDEGAI